MCGIFAFFSKNGVKLDLQSLNLFQEFMKTRHRGPDFTAFNLIRDNAVLGFHRLAIVDPHPRSHQPLYLGDDLVLVCNGEIYNHRELEEKYHFDMKTGSDCEVILHLYRKFGMVDAVKQILGEYVFVLIDLQKEIVYSGRDEFGVRPLFIGKRGDHIGFCSEAKGLTHIKIDGESLDVEPFLPGHIYSFSQKINNQIEEGKDGEMLNSVTKTPFYQFPSMQLVINRDDALKLIRETFISSVSRRLMSDRPIGCLLSGGLDSSLVTSITSKLLPPGTLHTFTIGLEGSVDVEAAKKVVQHLGIEKNHHIIRFSVEQGIEAIESVIYHLESYDVTTIRASTPQFLVSKAVVKLTPIRVLLSGEGADELLAGYQYSKDAPSADELDLDSKRLIKNLYQYDNLRTDRTTAAHGLEVRVPFLDRQFVDLILSLNPSYKLCGPKHNGLIEKKLMRDAFRTDEQYLPLDVLDRNKEAFSDAVSSKEKSWYKSLCEHIDKIITDDEMIMAKDIYPINTPLTKEALFYRNIFSKFYPNRDNLISEYWMPKWQPKGLTDPSATVLNCHRGDLELDKSIPKIHAISK